MCSRFKSPLVQTTWDSNAVRAGVKLTEVGNYT